MWLIWGLLISSFRCEKIEAVQSEPVPD